MAEPIFFCNIDTVCFIEKMQFDKTYKDIKLILNLIEIPYTFFFSADKENWCLDVSKRGEMYFGTNKFLPCGSVKLNKSNNTGVVNAKTSDDYLSQIMPSILNVCKNISCYTQEKNLDKVFSNLDPEEDGILLYVENEKLLYKVVTGAERPELMCSTLLGETVMMRPYMEDFWERSAKEMLSLEEKTELAENGDTDVMQKLALMYLNGNEVEQDAKKAVYWFNKLAEYGNSDAMFNLGLHYAKGFGVERDFSKAAYWMKQASDNGDEDAISLSEKYNKAALAVENLVNSDAQAQADLASVLMGMANSLEQAGTTENDFVEAFELAKKSAEQNNGDGIWTLALAYEHGRGVETDIEKAIELYKKGAEINHAPSQHSLACYYFRGDILKQDYEKGFNLCLKSAENGYGLAMRDVGRCYQFANGVTGNMKKAVEWYEKALEVLDDPELEQKVAIFKMIGKNDEHWGDDYQ